MKENQINNDRKIYLDIMRIVACFAVVLIHFTASNNGYSTFIEKTLVIFNGITRFSVPLFFMISGALFLNKKSISLKQIYKKNILKLLIILAVWLTFYGIFNYYRYGGTITSLKDMYKIFIGFISNQYHFWFIFPLIAIYISLPILKKISEDKSILIYFIILFLIFVIGYESLKLIFGQSSNKVIWISLFRSEIICGYTGYFLLGYYLEKYKLPKKLEKVLMLFGVLSFIIVSFGSIYFSKTNAIIYTEFCNNFIFTSLFMAVLMYLLIKKLFEKKEITKKENRIILFLSSNTLAVYIFHNLFRYLIEDYGIYNKLIYGPITLLITCFVVFCLCIFISYLIKKIPVIGKYLV